MFWRKDNDHIYAVYEGGSKAGLYESFPPWDGEDYLCPYSPPEDRFLPELGFGWVWCTQLEDPIITMGWALTEAFGQVMAIPLSKSSSEGSFSVTALVELVLWPTFSSLMEAFSRSTTKWFSRQVVVVPALRLLQGLDFRGFLREGRSGCNQILTSSSHFGARAKPRKSLVNGQCNNPGSRAISRRSMLALRAALLLQHCLATLCENPSECLQTCLSVIESSVAKQPVLVASFF
jgi:hypothetical protein